jgi:hypothetical protein
LPASLALSADSSSRYRARKRAPFGIGLAVFPQVPADRLVDEKRTRSEVVADYLLQQGRIRLFLIALLKVDRRAAQPDIFARRPPEHFLLQPRILRRKGSGDGIQAVRRIPP